MFGGDKSAYQTPSNRVTQRSLKRVNGVFLGSPTCASQRVKLRVKREAAQQLRVKLFDQLPGVLPHQDVWRWIGGYQAHPTEQESQPLYLN